MSRTTRLLMEIATSPNPNVVTWSTLDFLEALGIEGLNAVAMRTQVKTNSAMVVAHGTTVRGTPGSLVA